MADTNTLASVFLGSVSLVGMLILLLGVVAVPDLRWGCWVESEPCFMVEEAGRQVSYLPPIPKLKPSVIFVTILDWTGGVAQWWRLA